MSSSDRELEELIEKVRNSLYEQNANRIMENDMWSLIENLTKELEIGREHEKALQRSLNLLLQEDNFNINTKYVDLLDKYEKLDDLQNQMAMDIEKEKKEWSRKINETEEYYKGELSTLKNQKQHLQEQLQLAQASAALQCDEMESSLKRRLVDAHSKLRQSQNTVRNLQIELNNLRSQLTPQHTTPSQKLSKSDCKYQPLLTTRSVSGDETDKLYFVDAPSTSGAAHMVFKGIGTPIKKYPVPPLKQCTSADGTATKKNIPRKRKLYNPDDMDYLHGVQDEK